jgi:formylglycine-generating enzyme required for sulfatase activity
VTNAEFAAFLTSIGSLIRVLDDDDHHFPRFVRYSGHPGEDALLYDLWPPLAGIQGSSRDPFQARPSFEQLPVTLVTWLGAHLYCKSVRKRLPTEAEWELAARGAASRPYPWGMDMPTCDGVHIPSDQTLEVRNSEHCDNARTIPFPVMSAPQDVTPEGVFDLAGNVSEWVDDDALLKNGSTSLESRANVEKPGTVRGGAFNLSFFARTTARTFWLANNVADNLGFRCAKSFSETK